jgi:hypothetical protein
MARARKQNVSLPVEEQKPVDTPEDVNPGEARQTPASKGTERNGSNGRKPASSGKTAGRAAGRRPVVEAGVAPTPDLQRQLQALEELTRQSHVLLQNLGQGQQELRRVCGDLPRRLEEQLGRSQKDAAEQRQELRASLREIKELSGEMRALNAKLMEDRKAFAREQPAEGAPVPAVVEPPAPAPVHGWLGVTVEPAVVVAEVQPGSPAQAADLAPGDVIAAINGGRTLDAAEVRALVQETAPGDKVTIQRVRGGRVEMVETHFAGPSPETAQGPNWLGVTIEEAVVVAEVLADTPAQYAGLAQGDVITGINGVRINDARELQKRIDEAAGEEVTVQLARGEHIRVVRVRIQTPLGTSAPLNE